VLVDHARGHNGKLPEGTVISGRMDGVLNTGSAIHLPDICQSDCPPMFARGNSKDFEELSGPASEGHEVDAESINVLEVGLGCQA